MTRSLRFRSFILIALLIVPLFPPRVRAAEDVAMPASSPSLSVASTSTVEQVSTPEPVSVPTSTAPTTPESVSTTSSSSPILKQLPPSAPTSTLIVTPTSVVVSTVATTTTAVTTTENQVTSSSVSDDTRNEDQGEDEEDDALDLGDDQAELDARKDFTGVVRQSKPYTCGPAALATLLTQLGNDTSEDEVLEYVTPDTEKGVSLLSLKQAAQKLSVLVMLKTWTADEVLKYVQSTSDPVLIHDEKAGVGGHFSVLREYHVDKDMVELSDTEAGNITYSVADFRHIFTGSVLVVYEGEPTIQLRDEHTMLSDEKAADIWGKYVPVYLLAEQSGNAKAAQDAQAFKACINRALTIVNYQSRNAARQACYSALALNLKNDLSTSEEAKLIARYEVSSANPFNKDNEAGVGTAEIFGVLKTVLLHQETYTRKLGQFNQALQQGGGNLANLQALQNQLVTPQTKLSQAIYDRDALSSSLLGKQVVASQLNSELFSGLFVQNNQVFSLGAVGSQLNAQAATYQKLSQVLNSKLANLDAQINQKQTAITSYTKNQTSYQNQAAAATSQAKYWLNQVAIKKSQRKSYSYEQQNYQSYSTQAANASSNAQYYQNLINQANNDIANLRNQKTQAQTEVSTASAEKARLERLKAFGDQEVQRKKTLLKTLNDTIASLNAQLSAKNNTITTLQSQTTPLQDKIKALQQAKTYQDDLNLSASYIDGIKQRYGFTTLNYTNTVETERLITEEVQLEKGWDTTTQVGATMDLRGQGQKAVDEVNNAINLSCAGLAASTLITVITVPLTGVACGTALVVTTPIGLIEGFKGSKLLTPEELTTFERILNIGAGTLIIAGTAGKVFLSVGKNAKTAAASIALFSDGTAAGERELASAGGVLKGALKSVWYDLAANEGVSGSHVLKEHVRDAAYLSERIKAGSENVSTFFSKEIAEKEINKIIANNTNEILGWLGNKSFKAGLEFRAIKTETDIGFGLKLSTNGSIERIDSVRNITVVLVKTDQTKNGFVVLTAYPDIR